MSSRGRLAVMMTAMFLFGVGLGAAAGASESAGAATVASPPAAETVIHIVARRYRFEPDRISLKKGMPVVLELTSPEVTMSFNAPDFLVSEELPPGKVVRVHLRPDKTGDFVFVCDIYCGSGHEKMKGVINVGAP